MTLKNDGEKILSSLYSILAILFSSPITLFMCTLFTQRSRTNWLSSVKTFHTLLGNNNLIANGNNRSIKTWQSWLFNCVTIHLYDQHTYSNQRKSIRKFQVIYPITRQFSLFLAEYIWSRRHYLSSISITSISFLHMKSSALTICDKVLPGLNVILRFPFTFIIVLMICSKKIFSNVHNIRIVLN